MTPRSGCSSKIVPPAYPMPAASDAHTSTPIASMRRKRSHEKPPAPNTMVSTHRPQGTKRATMIAKTGRFLVVVSTQSSACARFEPSGAECRTRTSRRPKKKHVLSPTTAATQATANTAQKSGVPLDADQELASVMTDSAGSTGMIASPMTHSAMIG